MLTFTSSEEKQSQCFHLLGTAKAKSTNVNLISDNTSLISTNHSLLSEGCTDSCSFYSGPSDEAILSFGERSESCGSIAFGGGTESCGSIASVSGFSGATFSGGSFGGGSSSGGSCICSC